MTWLRDYGAFSAASLAAVVAILNGALQSRRDKQSKNEHWRRELRIPRYIEFIRAAEVYDMSIFITYGEWDAQNMGPQPKEPLPLPEAQRLFQQALAEILLVGPQEVAMKAYCVQYSLWRYTEELESRAYLDWPHYTDRARNDFFDAATKAVGLSFVSDTGRKGYKNWLAEQKATEKALSAVLRLPFRGPQ